MPRNEAEELARERQRREAMWSRLHELGGPDEVTVGAIQAAGIRPANTGQGIFRDHANTRVLGPAGVSLTLLDLGTSYDDAFDEEGGTYHYPKGGGRGGRDAAEVEATKEACRLCLPVFVVLPGSRANLRTVRRGWVTDFDDARGVFLIAFDGLCAAEPELFVPRSETVRERVTSERWARPGQRRFAFRVFKAYGAVCALCDHEVETVLEAAHVVPVASGGTDRVDNGLVLCRNHHRAFDTDLLAFEPETARVDLIREGPGAEELQLSRFSLEHLDRLPDEGAMQWRWPAARPEAGVPRARRGA